MNIRILHDPESVYADNQVMSAKELINDFIEGLNEIQKMTITTTIDLCCHQYTIFGKFTFAF